VGTVNAAAAAVVLVTGLFARGFVGQVNVWGQIDDNQVANWQNINNSQVSEWIP